MISAQRSGLSRLLPIQVTPIVMVMIPNAQTATPTTRGRSACDGRRNSRVRVQASRIATAHIAIAANIAGHCSPGTARSRIEVAAPAAPYALYATPMAVARTVPR